MAIATDGKGNYLTLDGDKWVPAQRARDQSGAEMVLDSGQWKPLPASSAPEPYTDPEGLGRPEIDPLQIPPSTPRTGVPPHSAASQRVGQAVAEGFQGGPSLPRTPPNLVMAPVYNPLLGLAETALRSAGGLYRGAQQLGVETISPLLGPQAARDIVSIPDAFMGSPGVMRAPGRPPIPGTEMPIPGAGQRVPFMHSGQPLPEPPPPGQLSGGVYNPQWVGRPGTINLSDVTRAVRDAPSSAPEAWRPVAPGEDFQPGRQYRMTPTGQREVNVGGSGPVSRGVPEPEAGAPQPQAAPASSPPTGAQPAGAQITPASEIGLTPQEEAAYRSTAEGNKLLEPQEPGVRDDKVYLTGERINEAEASQDVEVARELKSLREQTPELDKKMTADENHNNNIRYNAIQTTLPGQVQISAKKAAREKAMNEAKPAVFRNAADADVQPIAREMQDILNDPENRQNTQLRQYLAPLIERLINPDGTPKFVDARELLSWRQDVQHLTSGAATRADPNLSRISGILGKVLDVTDNQIEASAPGYKVKLRDEYRQRSREIDAMEALDAERTKLFDSQNVPNYNALQNLLKRIYNARIGNDPYEPFTHVPQATLDQLYNIRDSMRRSRAVDNLGKPRGSPTSQNLGDALRTAGSMAVKGAMPAIGATVGHMLIPVPFGAEAMGLVAGQAANYLLSQRGLRQRLERGLELTTPPQPNVLMRPGP